MAFGAGPELAAQCPRVPPPDGWRAWTAADGPVPPELSRRAEALVGDQTLPLGTTESFPLPGVTTLLRLEPHVWQTNESGTPVQGCFRASSIYLPSQVVVAPEEKSSSDKLITGLTIASLGVGIVATVATFKFRKRRS